MPTIYGDLGDGLSLSYPHYLISGSCFVKVSAARMSELTDPSKATQFYSSGSANSASFGPENVFNATWYHLVSLGDAVDAANSRFFGLEIPGWPKEMTKFMVPVCLSQSSCAAPVVNTTTAGMAWECG